MTRLFSSFLTTVILATLPGRARAAAFDMADARKRLETCVAGPGGLRLMDARETQLEESHRLILMKLRVVTALGARANENELTLMGVVFGGMIQVWLNHLPASETLAMYNDDPHRGPIDCLHGIVRDALDDAPLDLGQRRAFLTGVGRTLALAQSAATPARLMLKVGLGARLPALRHGFSNQEPAMVRTMSEDLRQRLRADCTRALTPVPRHRD